MPVDIKGFLARMGMKGVDLQRRLGVSSGNLSQYEKRANPSYQMVCRLIEEGFSAKELFGPELAKKLYENGRIGTENDLFGSDKFRKGVMDVIMSDEGLKRMLDNSIHGLADHLGIEK